MHVSKTVSIDLDDLVFIQHLVKIGKFESISSFIQIAISAKIQSMVNEVAEGTLKK